MEAQSIEKTDSAFLDRVPPVYEETDSAFLDLNPLQNVKPSKPGDSIFLLYCTALSLGASSLAPWLAYISAADFFIMTYPSAHLMYVFPVQNMGILFFGCFFMMRFGEYVPLTIRILIPNAILLITMTAVPILNMTGAPKSFALMVTLASQSAGSCCVTVVQQSAYGAGGLFGPKFTNALEVGKGLGGLAIILARIILKALLPANQSGLEKSTNIFFVFSMFIVVFTMVLWRELARSPLASQKISQYEEHRRRSLGLASFDEASSQSVSTSTAVVVEPVPKDKGQRPTAIEMKSSRSTSDVIGEKDQLLDEGNLDENGVANVSTKAVLCKVVVPAVAVCSTFTVCIGCFPGLTTSLVNLELRDWFPVLLVLVFSVADLLGKSLARFQIFDRTNIAIPALLHVGFIPLFLVLVESSPSALACFLTVFALGISTGYIATSCMMIGPQCVRSLEKVMAGQVMSTCLIAGLFTGSLLGALLAVAADV